MLFGLIIFLFSIICILLVLIILIQKGSSSLGLGNIGGSNQLLFGGSGGQDIFQKITWILTAIFMGGSLVLSIMKTQQVRSSRYFSKQRLLPQAQTKQESKAAPQPEQPQQ